MESLALVAALVLLSLFALSVLSLVLSFCGWRALGALCGTGAILAGLWLAKTLPANPWLGLLNVAAGAVSVVRLFTKKG
jgi:hypothetical protein